MLLFFCNSDHTCFLSLHLQSYAKDMSKYEPEAQATIHKIRITLSSLNVPSLEKGELLFFFLSGRKIPRK